MKAVGFYKVHPNGNDLLRDIDVLKPVATGRDLLVKVKAAAINPVDVKIRKRMSVDTRGPIFLGFDAAGTVEAVGPEVREFKAGDAVFYAGSIMRPGSYAEYQLVDERIAGPKPARLSFAEAAALPLTSITAWEMLFDRLSVPARGVASLLVIGGAGGVGSMAIQFARRLTDLTVIATASRPESRAWCHRLGAHHVVDHTRPLAAQVADLREPPVSFVFGITATDTHWPAIAEIMAPQGRFGLIDDPEPLDLRLAKPKSLSIHWENMFTRSVFETTDIEAQRQLLARVSRMVDAGEIETTMTDNLGKICAATVAEAHRRIVAGHGPGKMVLEGF